MGNFPARIHIIFAQESDYAMVFRRGSSKYVCTIGWDRSDNSFQIGQWLKGRLHEHKSDISPDGKHLIYFTQASKWDSGTDGTWTVISKTPYLKAVGLWSEVSTWNGGGMFLSNTKYRIDRSCDHKCLLSPSGLVEAKILPFMNPFGGKCKGVYYHRLLRDGWKLIAQNIPAQYSRTTIFEKHINSQWRLVKKEIGAILRPQGKGCHYDEHQLINNDTGEIKNYPDWEWADVDERGIYWAEKGKLFMAHAGAAGIEDTTELYNFNEMEFEEIKAPY